MRFLYTCLLYLMMPIMLLYLLYRSLRDPRYRQRLSERFGYTSSPVHPPLWIHAASVGEVQAAQPLVQKLINNNPDQPILITTLTPTGAAQITRWNIPQLSHTYLPYDVPSCLKRFLTTVRPTLCIVMETEIWINMIHENAAHQVPTVFCNARLTERSLSGYRYMKQLIRNTLTTLPLIATQSESDAKRFTTLLGSSDNIVCCGSIKFDHTPPAQIHTQANTLAAHLSERPIVIGASVHPKEDHMVINAFLTLKQQYPTAALILVPRHPENFISTGQHAENTALSVAYLSDQSTISSTTDILIGDTMGDLMTLYAISDAAFVGGSLIPIGGHNILEPASLSCPIIVGPYTQHSQDIIDLFLVDQAITVVHSSDELSQAWATLLTDKDTQGQRACHTFQKNKGACDRFLEAVYSKAPNLMTQSTQAAAHSQTE